MAARQMRAAVVGPFSLLAKELIEELNNSATAAWDLRLLDESENGETQLTATGDEPAVIQPLSADALEDVDIVFFAGDASTARAFRQPAIKAGAGIVDLTGALEGEPGMLVRSPWIGGGTRPDLTTTGVVAAHPAALMLALACDRLAARFGLKNLTATVLEPASQGGRAAVDELHQQTVSLLSFQSVPKEIFDTQVAFNLQRALGEASKIDLPLVSGRVRSHLTALLGASAAHGIRFQIVQAPVFHGYTISCLADLAKPASEEEVRNAVGGGVVQAEGDTEPSNLSAIESGDMLFSVEKERCEPSGTAQWLWLAADNLRFAARNAVAAAMELAALRPAGGVQ